MAKTRFEWDYKAAGDLMLRSQEIAEVCEAEAARMSRATGVEYVPDVRMGNQRVIASGRRLADGTLKNGGGGSSEDRKGRSVKGYWRTGKGGKRIWVQSYRRKT